MSLVRISLTFLASTALLTSFGCAEKKISPAAPIQDVQANDASHVDPAITSASPTVKSADPGNVDPSKQVIIEAESPDPSDLAHPDQAENQKIASPPQRNSTDLSQNKETPRTFSEATFLPKDVVALIVAHPKQFCVSPVGRIITELGLHYEIPRVGEILRRVNLSPIDIERVTIAVDREFLKSTKIVETLLDQWIQSIGARPINVRRRRQAAPAMTLPPIIFTLAADVNQAAVVRSVLGETTEEAFSNQSFSKNNSTAIWFPDQRTVVMGTIDSVKRMIAQKQTGEVSASVLFDQLRLNAELSFAVDLEYPNEVCQKLTQSNTVISPLILAFRKMKTMAMGISASGREGEPIIDLMAMALDGPSATELSAPVTTRLEQGKTAIERQSLPSKANSSDKEMNEIIKRLVSTATVTTDGDTVRCRLLVPPGYDRVPALLKPTLAIAQATLTTTQQRQALRQFGMAFHNFHDAYNHAPGSGRIAEDKPVGLSWRVYLLPFLDQADLYSHFKFDEPWDSDHNKTLIEKMPDIFKCPGVDAIGKTSYHLFTGSGSPFADDHTPNIAGVTDGLSNTILVVFAGADTAEIWTKPGGLDFDLKNPIKAVGHQIGDTFMAVMCDGQVKDVSKGIDADSLRRLIQHSDGEAVQ